MRDMHMVGHSKKIYVGDLEMNQITAKVRSVWPGCYAEGACGAWSWAIGNRDDDIVAEAWLHATKPGWWLRIKEQNA